MSKQLLVLCWLMHRTPLNNAGADAGDRTDNIVRGKTIRR